MAVYVQGSCQRNLFLLTALCIGCIFFLEISFFSSSELFKMNTRQNDASSVSIITSKSSPLLMDNEINNNNNNRRLKIYRNSESNDDNIKLHQTYDPSYDIDKDWFNSSGWHSNIVVNFSCPVYENICVYKQHFYVHSPDDQFDLKWKQLGDLLGSNMPNLRPTGPIYKKFFHATLWNENEYETSRCYYNSIYNHLILEASYQTMLGEFYSRTLRFLHYLKDIKNLITDDLQLWLLIGDQKSPFTSHYLFTERFTIYNLQHFSSMFDHIPCQCYHRILFCGFQKEGHEIPWPRKDRKGKRKKGNDILATQPSEKKDAINTDNNKDKDDNNDNHNNHTNLMPLKTLLSRMEPEEARNIYPEMIIEYNHWVDINDINLDQDIKKWKYKQLSDYFPNIDGDKLWNEIDEWKFIGLYDRKVRRSWLKIKDDKLKCNDKYNKYKIFCHIIILEGFLHSRDVIIIHRASFMLIGVHGAQLTDAIWMKYDVNKLQNKYIIELLPYGGPKYTSSINKPTALGVIFWNSHYNHVGMKLSNTSMQYPNRKWDENDFYVKWNRLEMVIDYLIMDEGGYCQKYGRADKLEIPTHIEQLGFAVYNAYCIENPSEPYHSVPPPRLY